MIVRVDERTEIIKSHIDLLRAAVRAHHREHCWSCYREYCVLCHASRKDIIEKNLKCIATTREIPHG